MAKQENALDRLERTKTQSNEREFTLEEQLDSVSTDDFLDGMSAVAKDNLGHLFTEVTEDENPAIKTPTPVVTETPSEPIITSEVDRTDNSDELFNNNTKPKRKYTKKVDNSTNAHEATLTSNSSNPVLDQLARDLIDDLRDRKHKINRFDDKSMKMIFDYMYNKF